MRRTPLASAWTTCEGGWTACEGAQGCFGGEDARPYGTGPARPVKEESRIQMVSGWPLLSGREAQAGGVVVVRQRQTQFVTSREGFGRQGGELVGRLVPAARSAVGDARGSSRRCPRVVEAEECWWLVQGLEWWGPAGRA
jgi:hypothetical protein